MNLYPKIFLFNLNPQVDWDFPINKLLEASFDGSSSALKSDLR